MDGVFIGVAHSIFFSGGDGVYGYMKRVSEGMKYIISNGNVPPGYTDVYLIFHVVKN